MNAKLEEVDGILKDAVGCVVTRDEHTRLKAFDQEYGWERYRKAGLRVMDTSKHPPQPKDNSNGGSTAMRYQRMSDSQTNAVPDICPSGGRK